MEPVAINNEQSGPNRVKQAFIDFTEDEAKYRVENPAAKRDDPMTLEHYKKNYQAIIQAYRKVKGKTDDEKNTLRYIRHEVRRINAKLKPTLLKRILHNRVVNWAFNTLLGRQANYTQHKEKFELYEKWATLETNSKELQKQLSAKGFTVNLEQALQKRMSHNLPEFTLRYRDAEHNQTDYVLHFKKIPGTDAYYFKSFDTILRPTVESVLKNDPNSPKLSFSTTDEVKFTAQEAAALISNRPVKKELDDGVQKWYARDVLSPTGMRQLDFDVHSALKGYAIKEMKTPAARTALTNALESGRRREVTLQLPGGAEEKVMVGVSGNVKDLNFYSQSGRYLNVDDLMSASSKAVKVFQKTLAKKEEQTQGKTFKLQRAH